MTRLLLMFLMLVAAFCPSVMAGAKSKAVREAAEHLFKKFGKEAGEKTIDALAGKIGRYGAKYGDEAVHAIRKAGPRGFQLLDDAGENAPAVARLLNRHGNEAVWVASKPKSLAIFVKHGDEAAQAMIRHPGIAESVIETGGLPAARALRNVSPQNARRINMMVDDRTLTAAGKTDELLTIIGKSGDKAAEFIWKHKGTLAVAAVAAAFIADPQPFIDGAKNLAEVAVSPLDSAAMEIGRGMAEGANWTVVIVGVVALVILFAVLRAWQPWKRRRPQ